MRCPANAPSWLQWAWKEIGTREVPENRGPAVRRYISLAKCGEEGDPWCAIFANAALESSGVRGTRSPSSQSFRHDENFTVLDGPALGAIAVFWRLSKASGLGHVGFYCGERSNVVWTLGGNEGDMVQIEFMARTAGAFGLEGYYWPKAVAVPPIAPIVVSADVPAHQVSVT
jgi:uncharacterized protein (TIGR02594 family)